MEPITLFGIAFQPHTWPLVFGLGGTWLVCAAITAGWGVQILYRFLID